MGRLGQDLRYGLRMLGQSPGFTAVAVLSLALGIGGNATVYSWVQAVLLRPLPGVQNSGQLLAVETRMPNGSYHTSSYPDYKDYRDQNQVFSGLIAFELIPVNFSIQEKQLPERIWGQIVTGNFFDVLGVRADLGRTFLPEEDRGLNAHPVVVISYGLWQTRFAGDTNIVGKTARFNQHPFTIIGVAPREFQGTIVGVASSFWVPMMMQPQVLPGEDLEQRAPTFIHLMGRMKPGITIEQAQANMATIAGRLEQQYPDTNRNTGIYVCPVWKAHYGLQDYLLRVLAFLTVVAALVLLIACANVANLLLARATVRAKEIAIRSALGASRARLVRQLLAESALLALLGGAGGVLLTLWTAQLLTMFLPPANIPIRVPLAVDGRVLSFTLLISLLAGIIFGLAPALQISQPDINESLKEGGRTSQAGSSRHRLRNLLVVSEMVLALVTLVGAGLLIRTLRNARNAGVGFNPDHVFLAAMDLRPNGFSRPQAAQFFEQLRERISALPEVQSVSTERYVPLWFYGRAYTRPKIEGYTPGPNEDMYIDYNMVGPNYFTTMQIPLVGGRDFLPQDRLDAPRVCVINETMARRFWPGQNPIGRRIDAGSGWRIIIGVARDIKYHSINESPQPFLYFPALQAGEAEANILVRTSGDPASLLGAVRHEVQALEPNAAILATANLAELLHVSLFAQRTAASLAAVLGLLGLFLAAAGIYGVLSYTVSQRTHEIGIRMALGAEPGNIVSLVVGQGMRLALISLAIGLAVSVLATRVMSSLLFGVSTTDPLTFLAVALLLAAVALAACYLPARRAMRVDPLVALRYE